jgi:toxin FitB
MAASKANTAPVVLDTSCWLEVLSNGALAANYSSVVQHPGRLIVPIITVYEVFKKLLRVADKETAMQAVIWMERGHVVELDRNLALEAAANGLPMAGSLIYATAQAHHATLWTQDAHFDGLPGVKYFPKD